MPRRTCPHCRELMHAEATTCPHCRERSDPVGARTFPEPESTGSKVGRAFGFGCLGLILLVPVLWIIGSLMMAANPEKYGGGSTSTPSFSPGHPDERTERVLSYTRDQLRQQCREQRRGAALERCLQEAEQVTKP